MPVVSRRKIDRFFNEIIYHNGTIDIEFHMTGGGVYCVRRLPAAIKTLKQARERFKELIEMKEEYDRIGKLNRKSKISKKDSFYRERNKRFWRNAYLDVRDRIANALLSVPVKVKNRTFYNPEPNVVCDMCRKEFYIYPSYLKRREKHFCPLCWKDYRGECLSLSWEN